MALRRPPPSDRRTTLAERCAGEWRSYNGAEGRQGEGWDWTARHWPRGWVAPPPRSRPSSPACARSCSPPSGCSPTRPPCRCSIPDEAGPRQATCGRSRATTGPGAAPTRRRWSMPMPSRSDPSRRAASPKGDAEGPRAGARRRPARRLPRHPAVRRLHHLQAPRRGRTGRQGERSRDAGLLLGARATRILRPGQVRHGPGRGRGAGTHRGAVPDRGRHPWPTTGAQAGGTPGTKPAVGAALTYLVRAAIRQAARARSHRGRDPLRAEPLGRARALPRRRPDRAGHQHGRARDPPMCCTGRGCGRAGPHPVRGQAMRT